MPTSLESLMYVSISNRQFKSSDFAHNFLLSWTHPILEDKKIAFAETPCNLGGYRLWLLCSKCKSRCLYLYLKENELLCRKCCGLNYDIQNSSKRFLPYTRLIMGGYKNIMKWENLRKKNHKGRLTRRARILLKKQLKLNELNNQIEALEKESTYFSDSF